MNEHVTNTIPRPERGAGGKGFNLQEAMGLADDDETYTLLRVSLLRVHATIYKLTNSRLQRSVRDLSAQAGLDCSVLWYRQPKDIISKIIGAVSIPCLNPSSFFSEVIFQARQRHSYLKRFPHGWAVEEFLKTNLKNKRAYARKRGYLEDKTNRGRERNKDDEDEDDGVSDSEKGDDGGERTDGNSGNSDPEEDNIEDIQDDNEGPSASASNENDDIYEDAQ